MTIAYTINLGGLSFSQGSTSYQLPNEPVAINRSWRKSFATAPHVAGRLLLSSVADVSTIGMQIRCYGGGSNPQTLVDAITAAVEAPSWSLAITWDGATRTWVAEQADWQAPIGGADEQLLHRRTVSLSIPVAPYPS